MDENKNEVSEEIAEETPQKLTFDELLKDPEYQREFDKKVAKSTEKAKAKWQKEADEKRSEAEALARMSEEEKHQHELDVMARQKNEALAELNAYRLKEEAQKIAQEKEMDISLLDLIDYQTSTAEMVKEKIELMDSSFKKAVEKAVNDKLKQPAPKQVGTYTVGTEKAYLDNKYKNNKYYKK